MVDEDEAGSNIGSMSEQLPRQELGGRPAEMSVTEIAQRLVLRRTRRRRAAQHPSAATLAAFVGKDSAFAVAGDAGEATETPRDAAELGAGWREATPRWESRRFNKQ